jgi:hypothetical protein
VCVEQKMLLELIKKCDLLINKNNACLENWSHNEDGEVKSGVTGMHWKFP